MGEWGRGVRAIAVAKVFAWLGATTVGGGRSAYFYEAFVVRRRWISDEEFIKGLTLGQLLPGPTLSNLTVFLGHQLRGPLGAALALGAVLLPGALVILALTALYFERGVGPGLTAALRGMGAAVVGFMLVMALRMSRTALRGRAAPCIAAATFLAVGPLRLNTALVLVVAGVFSLWVHRPGGPAGAPPARGSGA
jgi:chromate transporter